MVDIENHNDITKFFYIIYNNLLEKNNENKFAYNLVLFLKKFCFVQFKNIKNVKSLILNLKFKYKFAYKLCILLYIKCDLFHKLSKIYNFDFAINETKTLELVVTKLQVLHNNILYINAFDLYSYKKINDNIDMLNNDLKKESNSWEYETRNEIIHSLVLLVKHFGLKELELMGVKLIKYSDTINMTFKELSKYYNKQIVKVENTLKLRKQFCESFIELEKAFVMALITFDHEIYFDDFEILIKQKTN